MATGTVVDVVMPQMGVSVSEGTITRWLRSVGDPIAADEPLLEISTDKVDTEVPSPGSGVLQEILVQEGETVPVGTVVARIGAGDAPAAHAPAAPPEPEPEPIPEPVAAEPEPVPAAPPPPPPEPVDAPGTAPPAASATRFVSPVVARIASEHGIDPSTVPGTGRDGRVTKKDILAFVEAPAARAAAGRVRRARPRRACSACCACCAAEPAAASGSGAQPAPAPPAAPIAADAGENVEPMTPMRRGIAEHMRRSLDTAAHVTSAIEVDMSKVVTIRQALKADLQGVLRRQPHLPRLHLARDGRDAA